MLVFRRCWAVIFTSFLQKIRSFFLVLQSRLHFGSFFANLGLQWGSCSSQFSQKLQILQEKKRVEIEARKLMTFGRLLGGAGGRGHACLAMQILQNMPMDFITPCSPFGGAANLKGYAPCRRPLHKVFQKSSIFEPRFQHVFFHAKSAISAKIDSNRDPFGCLNLQKLPQNVTLTATQKKDFKMFAEIK